MDNVAENLDLIEERVMNGLMDFQRATVMRIDHLYKSGQRRILVSDEVGLGKTLIARGVVAKVAKLRKQEGDDLFKVVYVCSNAAIAEQNLRKLRITKEIQIGSAASSRLSMQHLTIFNQESDSNILNSYIQLIPLTPDTSFRMTTGAGIVQERALMFAFLKRIPALRGYITELDILMKYDAYSAWDIWCRDYYETEVKKCDKRSGKRYIPYMIDKLTEELDRIWHDDATYLRELKTVCRSIRGNNGIRTKDNGIVGQLRVIFAKISLEKLSPDLVIMDEFQRFKDLLNSDPESETGMLADKFFHSKNVRMLLLSATPYKMYSTPEEIDEARIDEHYSEFLSVMKFLNEDNDSEKFLTIWKDYSIKLKEMTVGDMTVISAKQAAEDALYQTVCRTERISARECADIIDDKGVRLPLDVAEQDIRSYIQVHELLDQIGATYHVPVDYIKSTPYLMSFMRDYQLKRNVERYFAAHPDEIGKIKKDTFWLKKGTIDNYDKIAANNARLERVMESVLDKGMDKLLWMPPSRPYYELQGAYKNCGAASKSLIFSAWEMVPRMLASLISYEAERRTVGKLAREYADRDVHYFYSGEKRYPSARMNFSLKNDSPSAMTLFCLLYPSRLLAECYDPIRCLNEKLSAGEIKRQIKNVLREKLKEFPAPTKGIEDKSWYYMAPILLDGSQYVYEWLEDMEKLPEDKEEKTSRQKGFRAHLEQLRDQFYKTYAAKGYNLGKRPADLLEVLADMAIGSPAICISRTYQRYSSSSEPVQFSLCSDLARAFIRRMNSPEATAVVELVCGRKSEDAHWQNLLTYCCQGCMQAVLDEYAHLLSSGIDTDNSFIEELHGQMMETMDFRTTQYSFDTFTGFKNRISGHKERPTNIRTHYAVAFTKGDGKEKDTDRKKTVRNAFNSPFRPFVLATTSIGQEGLDFHNYCRKIVHWNLPSNPIDLEQREGRINRFECLAIRQNIAMRYGNISFSRDIWKEMFKEAEKQEKNAGSSDLIPYWGLKDSDEMVHIERSVPMYPYSRDGLAYERLIKILSLYRLTLGQARQEELLEYLIKNCEDTDKLKELFINLSPFYKEGADKPGRSPQ